MTVLDLLICKVVLINWVFSFPLPINSKKSETNENPSTNNESPRNLIIDHHLDHGKNQK